LCKPVQSAFQIGADPSGVEVRRIVIRDGDSRSGVKQDIQDIDGVFDEQDGVAGEI